MKTETVNINFHYMALLTPVLYPKWSTKLVLSTLTSEKSFDNIKIDGGIPPSLDKKDISDIELMKFATEVDNVKRWYMSPEQ